MNCDESLWIELSNLILLSVEGKLDKEQLERLNLLLQTSSQARRCYFEIIDIHLGLEDLDEALECNKEGVPSSFDTAILEALAEYEKIAPVMKVCPSEALNAEPIKKIERKKTEHRINKSSVLSIAGVAAAVILVVLFARFAPPKSGFEVATLTDSLNAKWADVDALMQKGTRFKADETHLLLREGLVELLFDNDTKVTLEAPAEFQILTNDQITLIYGRLYATVPQRAIGFTVNTSSARIVDLGTEFGVEANFRGDTSLHVVRGKTVLIAGDESNKVSVEVGEGRAKKVSSNTQTISDISCNDRLFAREINSARKIVWRGEKRIDLADLIGGGSGFGDGRLNEGIDVSTGTISSGLISDVVKMGSTGYVPVDDCASIDGVFVPGLEDGMTPVTADGSITVEFPKTSGNYWGYLFNGAFHKGEGVPKHFLQLNGMVFGTPGNPAINIHSNQGITFDLSEIRKNIPVGRITQFRSLIGISETVQTQMARLRASENADAAEMETLLNATYSTADFWVFLDGRKVYEATLSNSDRALSLSIPVTAEDCFLTLAVTESDDTWGYDWALFGRPELLIESIQD